MGRWSIIDRLPDGLFASLDEVAGRLGVRDETQLLRTLFALREEAEQQAGKSGLRLDPMRWTIRSGKVRSLVHAAARSVDCLPTTIEVFLERSGRSGEEPDFQTVACKQGLLDALRELAGTSAISSADIVGGLNRLLECEDKEIARPALRAVAEVGDLSSYTLVEGLASQGLFSQDEITGKTAAACLRRLRERLGESIASTRLLRPASTPGETTLLRPAGSVAQPSGTLLRVPTETEDT
jgi:hypothetical protein